MKYTVEVGALVTVFRGRKVVVYAADENEAKAKAEERFRHDASVAGWIVDSVNIDSIEEGNDGKLC